VQGGSSPIDGKCKKSPKRWIQCSMAGCTRTEVMNVEHGQARAASSVVVIVVRGSTRREHQSESQRRGSNKRSKGIYRAFVISGSENRKKLRSALLFLQDGRRARLRSRESDPPIADELTWWNAQRDRRRLKGDERPGVEEDERVERKRREGDLIGTSRLILLCTASTNCVNS
jgi:hypothetical protein